MAYSCLATLPVAAEPPARPNVLWLVVEDMSPWIGPYGDRTVPTPNLDRLAAQGVTYDNAFATSPVCAPARSSLITAMYAPRIGTMHMRNTRRSQAVLARNPDAYADIPVYEGLPPAFVRCFPEHLRAAGYYCTNASKRDYQFNAPETVWDVSSRDAHWKNRASGQPFFAVFNHSGTHESRAFPQAESTPQAVSPRDVTVPPIYPDTPAVREALSRTYNNIAAMDAWVGDHLQALEDAGLMEQTVVFFYSDHGVGLPRGKRSCFDTGLRVPLIVRHPHAVAGTSPAGQGRPAAGSRDGQVVSFVDFGPTVLSIAGIEPDTRLDGTAFLGAHAAPRRGYRLGHAFAHADRFDAPYERTRTVSDGRYRYTQNRRADVPYLLPVAFRQQLSMTADLEALLGTQPHDPNLWQFAAPTRPPEALYDAHHDPWETENLIDAPEHHERAAQLRTKLEAWITDTGDLGMVLPEARLVREKIWPPHGKQPQTPAAQAQRGTAPGGQAQLTLSCTDPGASIGYRFSAGEAFAGPWEVARSGAAVALPNATTTVEIVTHRIGHKPTTITVMRDRPDQ